MDFKVTPFSGPFLVNLLDSGAAARFCGTLVEFSCRFFLKTFQKLFSRSLLHRWHQSTVEGFLVAFLQRSARSPCTFFFNQPDPPQLFFLSLRGIILLWAALKAVIFLNCTAFPASFSCTSKKKFFFSLSLHDLFFAPERVTSEEASHLSSNPPAVLQYLDCPLPEIQLLYISSFHCRHHFFSS